MTESKREQGDVLDGVLRRIGGINKFRGGERMKMFIIPGAEMERMPENKVEGSGFFGFDHERISVMPKRSIYLNWTFSAEINSHVFRFQHESFPVTPRGESFPIVYLRWDSAKGSFVEDEESGDG